VDGEVQRLLDAVDGSTHTGLRDRALLGVLAYTFARIGAVVNLKVEDYYPSGKRFLLRFKEKGGKEKELPVHHKLEELLDQYLKASGLEKEPGSPLFAASIGKTGKLSRRPLVRTDAADISNDDSNKPGCRRTIRLTPSARPASRTFWKMTAPLKPLNGSPVTQTAGPRNSMTAGARRFYSKTWRGFATELKLRTGDVTLPCTNSIGSIKIQALA
jgi:hypothetical protein